MLRGVSVLVIRESGSGEGDEKVVGEVTDDLSVQDRGSPEIQGLFDRGRGRLYSGSSVRCYFSWDGFIFDGRGRY